MAFLLSCWFIIDNVLLPPGFGKWYRLSFFIHPILLVIYQLFLVAKLIATRLLVVVSFLFQVTWSAVALVFQSMRNCIHNFFHISELNDVSVVISNTHGGLQVTRQHNILVNQDAIKSISVYGDCAVPLVYGPRLLLEDRQGGFEEKENDEGESIVGVEEILYRQNSSSYLSNFVLLILGAQQMLEYQEGIEEREASTERDQDIDESSLFTSNSYSSASVSNSVIPILKDEAEEKREVGETDIFSESYNKRMWWFDQLNAERRYAVSVILHKKLGSASLQECIQPMDFSLLEVTYTELARSLESDFEVIYVGQASLGWEALNHQYRKVETLACSDNAQEAIFPGTMAGKFQQFQVLLERFVENERHEGKRFWTYAHTRFSLRELLQVPEVSGYDQEDAGEELGGGAMNARELLEAMEKAIRAFWAFLKTDDKKSKGLLKRLLCTASQVEDPMDLEMLRNLSKEAHKKKAGLKNLQKKRRWPVKTNPLEDDQNIELLFCMIDIELVSRALKMSVVTTEQLKWCQEKLHGIELKQARVARTATTTSCLFPCS